MSPKLATMAPQYGPIQRPPTVPKSTGNSAMSDVSAADVVSFHTGDRPILSYGEMVGSERPDANSLVFGSGGHHVLLNMEVNESISWGKPFPSQNDPG